MVSKQFVLAEQEAGQLLHGWDQAPAEARIRYPLLAAYDLCLKCSHLFNVLDARGAISVTERASLIGRIRALTCRVAQYYLEQRALMAATAEVAS